MKILNNNIFSSNYNRKPSFKGTPYRLPSVEIRNYQDALGVWENLRFAKFLDAHQNTASDKMIRQANYSFLDKLTSYIDKASFVEKYCEFTKFPNLKEISDKIDATFTTCINNIARNFNCSYRSDYEILDSGYDPTCSLGLRKSFPGSDLDKGYIILKGVNSDSENETIVNNFKGALWEDLDQRIVSLNHENTFPSVYTKKQVIDKLNKYNKSAKYAGLSFLGEVTGKLIFTPLTFFDALEKYCQKPYTTTEPYDAALFNRRVAFLTRSNEREDVKNFAFFIETVWENVKSPAHRKDSELVREVRNSPFACFSNVTQMSAWKRKIAGGYMKSKLRNREQLEKEFSSMSTETKYDLVKDVIKYATDEQSNKFSKYFKNDDDIANRYERLLESLRSGV